jgi:hypothetical protein
MAAKSCTIDNAHHGARQIDVFDGRVPLIFAGARGAARGGVPPQFAADFDSGGFIQIGS